MNATNGTSKLYYIGTNIDVRLGDRISFRKLFKTVTGAVVYVPGQSPDNKAFGDNMWAIQLDNEPHDVKSMVYAPHQEPFAHKKITFIERGASTKAIRPDEEIT